MIEDVKEISYSSKHIPLKITGFIIAIIVAIVSFSIAFSKLNDKSDGYYQLNINKNHELYQNANNFTMMYKLQGNSDSIKKQLADLNLLYEQTFTKIIRLLDSETIFENVHNIAYINQHLNEEIIVDKELYNILTDAYTKTCTSYNYSIFASPLFQKWEKYSSFDELTIKEFDPYYNLVEKESIDSIAKEINNLQHFNLKIIDSESYCICFNVSESYQQFLKQHDLKENYIDLNILKDSYIIDYILNTFKANHYEEGYLYNNSGLLKNMDKSDNIEYFLNDYKNDQVNPFGHFNISSNKTLTQFRHFDLGKPSYYIIKDELKENIYRHPYLNIHTGYPNQFLMNSYMISNHNILDNAFLNNELQTATSQKQIKEIIKDQNVDLIFTQNEKDKKLYLLSNNKIEIELISAYDYQLIQL